MSVMRLILYEGSYAVAFGAAVAAITLPSHYLFGDRVGLVTSAWGVAEIIFFCLQRWRYHKLNMLNPVRPSDDDIDARISNFLTLANCIEIEEFISGWFMHTPFEQIKRDNVLDLIAYGFWYQRRSELPKHTLRKVDECLNKVEQAWGKRIAPGYNPDLQFMDHLLQPLRVIPKPLVAYIVIEVLITLSHVCLACMGFKRYQCRDYYYWTKGLPEPKSGASHREGLWQTLVKDCLNIVHGGASQPQAYQDEPFDSAIDHCMCAAGTQGFKCTANIKDGAYPAVDGKHAPRLFNTPSSQARQVAPLRSSRLQTRWADALSRSTRALVAPFTWFARSRRADSLRVASSSSDTLETTSSDDLSPVCSTESSQFASGLPAQEAHTIVASRTPERLLGSQHAIADCSEESWIPCSADKLTDAFPAVSAGTHAARRRVTSLGREATNAGLLPHGDGHLEAFAAGQEDRRAARRNGAEWQERREAACGGSTSVNATDDTPICFLHGVGIGVLPYLRFLRKLMTAFQGRPFILLEVRHVILRLHGRAKGVEDVVDTLLEAMQLHGVTAAHFIAHSFGTFLVAHIFRTCPQVIASSLLVDPVCMLTCFPKLLHNFIYRAIELPQVILNPMEAAKLFVSRDLVIAETFCRHFWWHQLMLWPHELRQPTLLVVSEEDELVPSDLVVKQLSSTPNSPARVMVHPSLMHGQFLMAPQWQDKMIKEYGNAMVAARLCR